MDGSEGRVIDTTHSERLLLSKVLCLGLDSLKPGDSPMPDPLCLPKDTLALVRVFVLLPCSAWLAAAKL